MALTEEISWRQESIELWLEGYRNTKIFHIGSALKKRSKLGMLKMGEVEVRDKEGSKEQVCFHFENLCKEFTTRRPWLDDMEFKSLGKGSKDL